MAQMGSGALRLLSFIFVNTNQPQSKMQQFSLNSAVFLSSLVGEINRLPLIILLGVSTIIIFFIYFLFIYFFTACKKCK